MSDHVIGEPPKVSSYRPLDGHGEILFKPDDCLWHWWTTDSDPEVGLQPGDKWTHLFLTPDRHWVEYTERVDYECGGRVSWIGRREVTEEDILKRGVEIPARFLARPPDHRPEPTAPPSGPSPSVGSDRTSDWTEAAAEQPALQPAGEPAAAESARTPREDRQAAGADASGSKAPGRRAGRQARKVPRGELDERAVAKLLENPTLNYDQLAEALGCRPGTLRDKAKCPKLASARASIRAQREAFRGGSTWRDRHSADDEA